MYDQKCQGAIGQSLQSHMMQSMQSRPPLNSPPKVDTINAHLGELGELMKRAHNIRQDAHAAVDVLTGAGPEPGQLACNNLPPPFGIVATFADYCHSLAEALVGIENEVKRLRLVLGA